MSTPANKFLSIAIAIGLLLTLCRPCGADMTPREQQVKAAFIYNFSQFVEWPADAFAGTDAPFVVAIVGADPFNGALEHAMANKSVGDRPMVVKHFKSVDNLEPCQILFIPSTQDDALASILARVGKSPTLTVGDSDAFMPAGGAIGLMLEDGHMRFQLDPDVLDAARLKASAKLMKLARVYQK